MAPSAGMRGVFITFEGGEGAGKSTQLRRLAERLHALPDGPAELVVTREPGGSPGAEAIRSLLVAGDADRWDATTEALLHFAARRDHVERRVRPALERGAWVVCDRFVDSTMAYQGYGHRLGAEAIAALARLTLGDLVPDLTLVLDLPPTAGLARAAGRDHDETRYERMDVAFHERLRAGFHAIAAAQPGRCRLIDATAPVEAVAEAVWAVVTERFGLVSRSPEGSR